MSRSTSWCCSARVAVATTTRWSWSSGRDQVAERLPGAGAGLDQQVLPRLHRRSDRVGHLDLARPVLAADARHGGRAARLDRRFRRVVATDRGYPATAASPADPPQLAGCRRART